MTHDSRPATPHEVAPCPLPVLSTPSRHEYLLQGTVRLSSAHKLTDADTHRLQQDLQASIPPGWLTGLLRDDQDSEQLLIRRSVEIALVFDGTGCPHSLNSYERDQVERAEERRRQERGPLTRNVGQELRTLIAQALDVLERAGSDQPDVITLRLALADALGTASHNDERVGA